MTLHPPGRASKARMAALCTFASSLVASAAASATPGSPGELVSSFGTGGVVAQAWGVIHGEKKVAVDSSDRIYVQGRFGAYQTIRRFLPSGQLDGSYGSSGTAQIPNTVFGSTGNIVATDIDVDASGRLFMLVNVERTTAPYGFSTRVARLDDTGTAVEALSPSLQYATTAFSPTTGSRSMLLLADGSVFLSAYVDTATAASNYNDILVAKLTPSLQLEAGFGDGTGKLIFDVAGGQKQDTPMGMSLLPDGSFVLAVQSYGLPGGFTHVAHFSAQGALDAGFGGGATYPAFGPFTGLGQLLSDDTSIYVQSTFASASQSLWKADLAGVADPAYSGALLPALSSGDYAAPAGNGSRQQASLAGSSIFQIASKYVPNGPPVTQCFGPFPWDCYTFQPSTFIPMLSSTCKDEGTANPSVGTDGTLDLAALGAPFAQMEAVVTLSDGDLIVVGDNYSGSVQQLVMARVTHDGEAGCGAPIVDTDGDGVADDVDNCPTVANADQNPAACAPGCFTVQRGVSGTVEDTYLSSTQGNWPSGAQPWMVTGGSGVGRALIRFDVSGIPAAAHVTSATVTVYVDWAQTTTTMRVHNVLHPWSEATASYTNFWGTEHFDATVEATFPAASITYQAFDLTALADEWASGATPNHGILLEEDLGSVAGRHQIYGSEGSNVGRRPKLEVCYAF